MKNLLIVTVGIGTAGKGSGVDVGLYNTITKIRPRRFWFIPSSSEESRLIADEVSKNFPNFAGILGPIENPEDLASCRQTVRNAIRKVKKSLESGEKLILNPTFGTKQMSGGAMIAALDEMDVDIVFTSGDRADGVVKMGTEQIVLFDSTSYFIERDCQSALKFFKAGDFYAAEQLLSSYKKQESRAHAVAELCLKWQRFDYPGAASAAAKWDQNMKKALSARAENVKNGRFDPRIVADLLAWSFFAFNHRDLENAVRLSYKALEYAARAFLEWDHHLSPDQYGKYPADTGDRLNLSFPCRNQLNMNGSKPLALGLYNLTCILGDLKHPFAAEVNGELLELSRLRNGNTHGIQPVGERESRDYCNKVRDALCRLRSDFSPTKLPVDDLPLVNGSNA